MQSLVRAMSRLQRRGKGERAWTTSVADEPLAFLLDAISDAWMLRERGGKVLFANAAARALSLETRPTEVYEKFRAEGKLYERRTQAFEQYVLEVVRVLPS